jgi:hypothetical protein
LDRGLTSPNKQNKQTWQIIIQINQSMQIPFNQNNLVCKYHSNKTIQQIENQAKLPKEPTKKETTKGTKTKQMKQT